MKYFIYDFNGILLFKKGFNTYQQAFDFCLDKFKFDEEMDEIIIKGENMNIKELIKELSDYPQDTRIDFILLDKDWEDSTKDTYLNIKGIVGSGADDVNEYIEFGLENLNG